MMTAAVEADDADPLVPDPETVPEPEQVDLLNAHPRIGAAEGIDPQRLGDVNMTAVARWFADQIPDRRYPAIMIGSSNGALAHLAAALNVPLTVDVGIGENWKDAKG